MTQNQLQYMRNVEEARHNAAVEAENARHNLASEYSEQRKAGAAESQAESASRSVDVQREHFQRADAINAQSVQVQQKNADTNWYNAVSTREHYERSDDINKTHFERMDEYTRSHYQNQDLVARYNAVEQARHNYASEDIGRANVQVAQSQVAADYARIAEMKRSNLENESINRNRNFINLIQATSQSDRNSAASAYDTARTATEKETGIGVARSKQFENITFGIKNITGAINDIGSIVTNVAKTVAAPETGGLSLMGGNNNSGSYYDNYGNWIGNLEN